MQTPPPKHYTAQFESPRTFHLQAIGIVHSPYTERHGTPRQAVLQHEPEDYTPVQATIELYADIIPAIALKDIQGFDRIWVISFLHLNQNWNPTVRPPRGPRIKRGTLATRAPHRPNPIGLSSPRLLRVEGHRLIVEGIDLLDQTPVLDIKPYVTYCDAFPNASSGYVDELNLAGAREKDIWGAKQRKNSSPQGPRKEE